MRLWSFIIVLAIAALLGTVIRQDPGFAFFSYGAWTVEMPLWLSVILLISMVVVLLMVLWTIHTVFSSSNKVKIWWIKQRENNARLQTYRGLLELAEGRWQKAERYLSQSAPYSDTPLINYLSAAQAAEEGGSPERRDRYLQLAFDVSAGSDVAVRLTQAQLQFKHGELEQSVRNLQRLHQDAPKHPKVLRLLCTLYEAMNDWKSLYLLLPALRKTEALPKDALERLEQKIYPALLPLYAEKGAKVLIKFWQECPRNIQQNPTFVYEYAQQLMAQSEHDEAETLLRNTLKKNWNENLVLLYGFVASRQPKKQLSFAESLVEVNFNSPALRLTLGKLYLNNQLWGKAREHLEQSLALKPSPETYAELGQLMDHLGQHEKRDEYFKKGLLLATRLGYNALSTPQLCLSYQDRL